ncbi:hypothetical protein PAXINDRAFT_165897 [Paxillus involutus ATCC 200175]|nr:hypothetical protein PAXINDRAFT_165897 [Paxillus involutus ATCC 200175]
MGYEEKGPDAGNVEKYGVDIDSSPVVAGAEHRFDVASIDVVQRRLKQRHVQMYIAGTLGTGLFLGSGEALSGAGPLGALIVYALVGTVAYSSLCSIGEMTSHAPISGAFPHFAARWVDPALGFATKHAGIYTAVIAIAVCALNVFVSMITGLILMGLIIDLGGGPNHQRLGFQYWKNPGVLAGAGLEPNHPSLDKCLGILNVLVQAAFSFQGMEIVAITASETENPRRNIAKAVRRVFYRICIFYMLGIFITGLLVPYNDPSLLHTTGTAAQSPYVIAMTRAGIKVFPSIINAGIMTSAFSAANSFLFCESRIFYGLALRGQAPRFLTYCTKTGLPIPAVLLSAAFAFLSLMNISSGAATVFNWFVHLSTIGGFFSWASMNLTYLYFYRGMEHQGIDRKQLHYWSPLQPYLAIWGLSWSIILIFINGFSVFWDFKVSDFLAAYINIPLFFGLYFFWKFFKNTKIWKPEEMDFVTGIPTVEETEDPIEPPVTVLQKIAAALF